MERIDSYFEGVAWKYLSAVDAEPSRSNQHELGGLVRAGFKSYLGDPGSDTVRFPARFIFLSEDQDCSLSVDSSVSWYDSRRANHNRSPELRLYYENNPVTDVITEGMLLVVAKTRSNELVLVFAEAESSGERQLRWLFGLNGTSEAFESKDLGQPIERSSWAALWILEQLGVEVETADEEWLECIIQRFGSDFPSTKDFSDFTRGVAQGVDAVGDPDCALVTLVDTEERLFRLFERHIVEQKLRVGFDDVDTFIGYSLSVHNRRKSRMGHAFENHLGYIFDENALAYKKGAYTENRSKPDFLFPGGSQYHDPEFPVAGLAMLGVKSTCKDRWRQVLSEAQRIREKHLVTLEPGISSFQTNEMQHSHLQLVVPSPIQETFSVEQQTWLWSIKDFVEDISNRQARYM